MYKLKLVSNIIFNELHVISFIKLKFNVDNISSIIFYIPWDLLKHKIKYNLI